MVEDLVTGYWREAAERQALATGTREQRLEYQTRSFPIEESLSARIDGHDAALVGDMAAIAEAAPDDKSLGLFGAGILWELLYNGGDDYAIALESHARSSEKFLGALRAAFAGWDGIKPGTKQRLRPLIEA